MSMGGASGRMSMGGAGRPSLGGRQSFGGRQSIGGRLSMASSGRRSSIHAAHSSQSDPRPLSDPEFRSACVRNLIQFLSENGFQYPISQKILTNPSDQIFFQIFQFLYAKIDPKFEFQTLPTAKSRRSVAGRQEGAKHTADAQEQVPMLLKALGYPIKLNKSAFISCGSRSNWPKMLGALQFLLEIATLQETVDVNKYIFAEADDLTLDDDMEDEERATNSMQKEMNFEYLFESYRAFLQGDDELREQIDDEMMSSYVHENEMLSEKVQIGLTQTEQKKMEIETLKAEQSALPKLEEIKTVRMADIGKFQNLIGNLEARQAKFDAKVKKLETELQLRGNEKAGFLAENKRLQQLRDNQELTPADAEKISTARKDLDAQIESVMARKQEVEQRAWKQEMALTKDLDKAQNLVGAYNADAERLQLIPAESRIAGGVDFEIRISPYASQPGQPLVLNDIKQKLVPSLAGLQEKLTNAFHSSSTERHEAESEGERMLELVSEMDEKVARAKQALAKEESALVLAKQQMETDQVTWDATLEELQEENMAIRDDMAMAQGDLAAVKQDYEVKLRDLEETLRKEKDEYDSIAMQTLELITEMYGRNEECVTEYKATVEKAGASA